MCVQASSFLQALDRDPELCICTCTYAATSNLECSNKFGMKESEGDGDSEPRAPEVRPDKERKLRS